MDEPEFNPYAPPTAPIDQAPVEAAGDLAEAEAIRRKYLNHEASVRSVGSLHYLAAFFTIVGMLGMLMTFGSGRGGIGNGRVFAMDLSLGIYAALTAFHVALGVGLNGLKTWARWVETVLVGLVLLSFLVGMGMVAFLLARGGRMIAPMIAYGIIALIPGYILYLLISQKGTVVFSPAYRVVIDRTPHIKYQTSCLVWFLLVLFLGPVAIAAIVGALSHR